MHNIGTRNVPIVSRSHTQGCPPFLCIGHCKRIANLGVCSKSTRCFANFIVLCIPLIYPCEHAVVPRVCSGVPGGVEEESIGKLNQPAQEGEDVVVTSHTLSVVIRI